MNDEEKAPAGALVRIVAEPQIVIDGVASVDAD